MTADIQCECGQFRARLRAFPRDTPGRLVCYCDDCQTYLRFLGRADLLDSCGGTEVIPVWPADVEILSGVDQLVCTRLSPQGTYRFSTRCCNTPVVNTRPGMPWAGFLRGVFTANPSLALDATLGPVRSRIMGRFASARPPAGTPDKFNLHAMRTVMPFILKGKLTGKSTPSPFFAADGTTPVVTPRVLTRDQREAARP